MMALKKSGISDRISRSVFFMDLLSVLKMFVIPRITFFFVEYALEDR